MERIWQEKVCLKYVGIYQRSDQEADGNIT